MEATGFRTGDFRSYALCVAYSGQCFSSEAWGGRSANRGQCAQACRLSYDLMVDGEQKPLADARYLLSPGDLCTVEQVSDIVAAGVGALKIEGRYKDADYVALTTHAYREAVDSEAREGAGCGCGGLGCRAATAGAGLFARAGSVVRDGDESSGCGGGSCAAASGCSDGACGWGVVRPGCCGRSFGFETWRWGCVRCGGLAKSWGAGRGWARLRGFLFRAAGISLK